MVDVYHRREIYRKNQKGTEDFIGNKVQFYPFGNIIDGYLII